MEAWRYSAFICLRTDRKTYNGHWTNLSPATIHVQEFTQEMSIAPGIKRDESLKGLKF